MATWKKIVTESSSNTIAQATTGNAATATALANGRTIGMTGDVVWTSASFDGSGNVTGSATIQANSVALGTDTTGNYVATIADSGTGGITVANSGSETAGVTLEFDINGLTAAAIASGDQIAFSDEGATGDPSKKESIDDIATLFAGTGLSASSAVISIDAAQTGITSLLATDIKIGEDDETKIDFETANEIHFYANNVEQVYLGDNIFGPQSDSDVDLGTTGVRWKDAYIDTITTTGDLTVGGDVRVNGNDIKASDGTTAITLSGADVTVAGDLTVSGDTTTLNTATLEVEDATVVLAKVGSPTTTTGNGAGVNIYTSATGADTAELAWIKDQGAGNTDGSGTATGLTGWHVRNAMTSNHLEFPIAVMEFSTNSTAPTGKAAGIGSFHYDTGDDKLYIRTA